MTIKEFIILILLFALLIIALGSMDKTYARMEYDYTIGENSH